MRWTKYHGFSLEDFVVVLTGSRTRTEADKENWFDLVQWRERNYEVKWTSSYPPPLPSDPSRLAATLASSFSPCHCRLLYISHNLLCAPSRCVEEEGIPDIGEIWNCRIAADICASRGTDLFRTGARQKLFSLKNERDIRFSYRWSWPNFSEITTASAKKSVQIFRTPRALRLCILCFILYWNTYIMQVRLQIVGKGKSRLFKNVRR